MKLTSDGKLFLGQLRQDPKFKHVLRELQQLRPVIQSYRPQSSQEANQQLMEEIKYDSGRQAGFDLIYRFLTGELNG